jgi:hypothetical protein
MPSTWKLRLWDSLEQRETVAQVSRAVAALSPSGFRGNRVQIPAEDLPSVKAKVRAAWRRVNGPDREIPAVIKRDMSNYLEDVIEKGGVDYMNLQENEINDIVTNMSDADLTDTQKQSILSKLGDFLFGKSDDLEKVVDVTDNVEEKSAHSGMEDEDMVKSEDSDLDVVDVEADVDGSDEESSVDEGEEMDLEKVLEGLSNLLDEKLEKVKADITAEVDGKIEAIEKSVSEVKESAEEISSDLEKVANSGAEKKSADIEADVVEEETLEKSAGSESFWGGKCIPVEVAQVLGYNS